MPFLFILPGLPSAPAYGASTPHEVRSIKSSPRETSGNSPPNKRQSFGKLLQRPHGSERKPPSSSLVGTSTPSKPASITSQPGSRPAPRTSCSSRNSKEPNSRPTSSAPSATKASPSLRRPTTVSPSSPVRPSSPSARLSPATKQTPTPAISKSSSPACELSTSTCPTATPSARISSTTSSPGCSASLPK